MTYILAEIASAHMGNPELCKDLIEAAYDAGADGVKVQVWTKGEVQGIDDKCIPFEEWEDIALIYPELIGQYYGKSSEVFCEDHFDNSIAAYDKRWGGSPIWGVQNFPTYIGDSQVTKVNPGDSFADHTYFEDAEYASVIALTRGAVMLEKHICLDRLQLSKKSRDWVSALEPDEFKVYVESMKELSKI
jgi:sialic acid synthase SpsE